MAPATDMDGKGKDKGGDAVPPADIDGKSKGKGKASAAPQPLHLLQPPPASPFLGDLPEMLSPTSEEVMEAEMDAADYWAVCTREAMADIVFEPDEFQDTQQQQHPHQQ